MKKHSILALSAAAVLGLTALTPTLHPVAAPAAVQNTDPKVTRGAYLVKIMACNDCHTPWTMGPQGPEPDMTRMLSGHPQDMVVQPLKLSKAGSGPAPAPTLRSAGHGASASRPTSRRIRKRGWANGRKRPSYALCGPGGMKGRDARSFRQCRIQCTGRLPTKT